MSQVVKLTIKTQASPFKSRGINVANVEVDYKQVGSSGAVWIGLAINILIPVAIVIILIIMFKSAQGQGSQALSFGRSRARLYGNEQKKVTFDDVAGNENAKDDLKRGG